MDAGGLGALVCDIDGVILHDEVALPGAAAVSYTHLTLPTNREV